MAPNRKKAVYERPGAEHGEHGHAFGQMLVLFAYSHHPALVSSTWRRGALAGLPGFQEISMNPSEVLSLVDARANLSKATGTTFLELLRRGNLSIEIWKPEGVDTQQPHAQDELYFVVSGEGEFAHGTRRNRVQTGDVLFVAAHTPHRFESFSPDFTVWVVFYGP
jgi:mannose-6-phosphate isomerase-like protein (cupin superfamily)